MKNAIVVREYELEIKILKSRAIRGHVAIAEEEAPSTSTYLLAVLSTVRYCFTSVVCTHENNLD